jgi:hypothetical protein
MVKITLEFPGVDEAIVALGKLVGASVKAAKPAAAIAQGAPAPDAPTTRRGRADKGKPRGPHKPAEPSANAGATGSATAGQPGPAGPQASTDPHRAGNDAGVTLTSADPVHPVAPAAAQPAPASVAGPAAAVLPEAEAQAALEALFNGKGLVTAQEVLSRFGVVKLRDLKPAQRAEFIAKAKAVLAGEAV